MGDECNVYNFQDNCIMNEYTHGYISGRSTYLILWYANDMYGTPYGSKYVPYIFRHTVEEFVELYNMCLTYGIRTDIRLDINVRYAKEMLKHDTIAYRFVYI